MSDGTRDKLRSAREDVALADFLAYSEWNHKKKWESIRLAAWDEWHRAVAQFWKEQR